jgi:2-(1,2-epoxy-1,2-dihydrophenyl)acetyl-CoA isomerase
MSYPQRPTQGNLLHWREGSVAQIRFNRPTALNALDVPMTEALHRACTAIEVDPEVRVLVLSGEGPAFQAGGDVVAMSASPHAVSEALIENMHGAIRALNRMRCPVIAQVQGAAAGAAIGLLMASDLVVASDDARFSLAFPALGASADSSSTWGLPRVLGLRRALRFALLGETLDAQRALAWGLVSEVVPPAELAPTVERWAAQIARSAPLALGALKQLLRGALDHPLDEHLRAEATAFQDCAGSGDFIEGCAAFLAKRRPEFTGR